MSCHKEPQKEGVPREETVAAKALKKLLSCSKKGKKPVGQEPPTKDRMGMR